MNSADIDLALQQARRNLPAQVYSKLLHIAATTGMMPVLDPDGTPTDSAEPIPPNKRLDLLTALLNKTVPDYKPVVDLSAPESDTLTSATPLDRVRLLRSMTTEQLRALRAQAATALPAPPLAP